jgi:ATP-dependent Zn protease
MRLSENVYQRIVVGARGDVKFSMRKKELVAYHEAGHAISWCLSHPIMTLCVRFL